MVNVLCCVNHLLGLLVVIALTGWALKDIIHGGDQ